ncbi:hypothetical protein BLNAU_9106 [Blattamonas nauphoetae]|uniref:Protein kinase domain-containing protein n=1 Tax=Blattamonas nauphoetae TaxID=2049346 RepID=A0ABQ9XWU3_9EUKA|nr:hypothetical protein BLNAU_9106 [Blattamonas nauphoetae]
MKWWLPLAIVLGVSLLVLMLIVLICWRRRKLQPAKKEVQKEELQEEDLIEKMDIGEDPTVGRLVIESSAEALKDKTITKHGPEQAQTQFPDSQIGTASTHPFVEMVEVMDCASFGFHFVSRQNSLYHRLHVEKNQLEDKRGKEQQLAAALLKMKKMKPSADILLHLSSHWLKINKEGDLCLLLEDGIRPPNGEQSHTEVQTDRKPNLDCEREKSEGERWRAPEQFLEKGEVEQQIDPSHVSVFRLGLVLWEIETGQIPFGETDVVNACRQLKAGIVPAMDGVQSMSMRELITRCLCVNADDRPSLESVATTPCEMEENVLVCLDGLIS